jgi:hypothetical protein
MSLRAAERAAARLPKRHVDQGAHAWRFLGESCDVLCPRCDRPGVVRYTRTDDRSRTTASFHCHGCHQDVRGVPLYPYAASVLPGVDWFGACCVQGQRSCGHCGARGLKYWKRLDAGETRVTHRVQVRCPGCKHDSELTLSILPMSDNEVGYEPATGMRLARSEAVMQGRFVWAYNAGHQAELARYVAARLREGTVVANASFVSRLPAWLKSARHRNKVLAALARIERRMPSNEE